MLKRQTMNSAELKNIRSDLRTFLELITLLAPLAAPLTLVTRPASAASLDSYLLKVGNEQSPSPSMSPAASNYLMKAPAKISDSVKKRGMIAASSDPFTSNSKEPSQEATYETIQSLTQLLSLTPPGQRRNLLLLNRAAALNMYGRRLLLSGNDPKIIEKAAKFLNTSTRDATIILNDKNSTSEQTLRAHYLLGYSYLYLNDNKLTRSHFLELLRLNPNIENSGWIGLYLGEEFFDDGNFAEAARFYITYFSKMTPQAQEIALYKHAWCLLNLKQISKSIESFVKLAQAKSKYGLAKDALRDVAYLATHEQNAEEIIMTTGEQFKDPQLRIDFLEYVRESLESQNSYTLHSKVIDELLKIETQSEKILGYLLANLRVNRKLFASHSYQATFMRMATWFIDQKISPQAPELKKLHDAVEAEMKILIKSFVDTLAGRSKTNEEFTQEELSAALEKQFEFFVTYLPLSTLRQKIVNLWLDTCIHSNRWACVDSASELIIKEGKTWPSLVDRAYIDQLSALEKLIPQSSVAEKRKLSERKLLRTKEYVELFPNSPQWIRIAKSYAQIDIDQEKFKEALPLLEKIYAKEPNSEEFYRIEFAKFKIGDHNGIIQDPRWSNIPASDIQLLNLKRETLLTLCVEARKKGEISQYNQLMKQFLSLETDPKKAIIARIDHLKFLLEKDQVENAIREFLSIDIKTRTLTEFSELRSKLWLQTMERGSYPEAKNILSLDTGRGSHDLNSSNQTTYELAFRRLITRVAMGEILKAEDTHALSAENREYVISLLAIAAPSTLLQYFQINPSAMTGMNGGKDLALLALRIKSGLWNIPKTPEAEKLLGNNYAFSGPDAVSEQPIERQIRRIQFPQKNANSILSTKIIEGLVTETRKVRSLVAAAIEKKNPYLQVHILEIVREHEKKVGQTLIQSPIPKGLTVKQMKQYQQALAEAAQEFFGQANEFDRLANVAKNTITHLNSTVENRVLPLPPLKAWRWPSILKTDPAMMRINDAIEAKRFLAALMLLDFFKADHIADKNQDAKDYFRIRTGILLASSESPPLRIYLLDELENQRQIDIINEWKNLKE